MFSDSLLISISVLKKPDIHFSTHSVKTVRFFNHIKERSDEKNNIDIINLMKSNLFDIFKNKQDSNNDLNEFDVENDMLANDE